jgi:hypothetical protein
MCARHSSREDRLAASVRENRPHVDLQTNLDLNSYLEPSSPPPRRRRSSPPPTPPVLADADATSPRRRRRHQASMPLTPRCLPPPTPPSHCPNSTGTASPLRRRIRQASTPQTLRCALPYAAKPPAADTSQTSLRRRRRASRFVFPISRAWNIGALNGCSILMSLYELDQIWALLLLRTDLYKLVIKSSGCFMVAWNICLVLYPFELKCLVRALKYANITSVKKSMLILPGYLPWFS